MSLRPRAASAQGRRVASPASSACCEQGAAHAPHAADRRPVLGQPVGTAAVGVNIAAPPAQLFRDARHRRGRQAGSWARAVGDCAASTAPTSPSSSAPTMRRRTRPRTSRGAHPRRGCWIILVWSSRSSSRSSRCLQRLDPRPTRAPPPLPPPAGSARQGRRARPQRRRRRRRYRRAPGTMLPPPPSPSTVAAAERAVDPGPYVCLNVTVPPRRRVSRRSLRKRRRFGCPGDGSPRSSPRSCRWHLPGCSHDARPRRRRRPRSAALRLHRRRE